VNFILRVFGRGPQAVPWNSEESIREELFMPAAVRAR
jgi:hypothetical protein